METKEKKANTKKKAYTPPQIEENDVAIAHAAPTIPAGPIPDPLPLAPIPAPYAPAPAPFAPAPAPFAPAPSPFSPY